MARYTILYTDFAWPVRDIEARVLAEIDAVLLEADTGEEAELLELAPQVDAIMTIWQPVTAAVLDAAPNCRIVSNVGAGVDNIDVAHATRLGIPVTNVPDYCVEEVSDHAMALLLACARRIAFYDGATRGGAWDRDAGRPLFRIRGQTLALIGYGNIARALVPKALGFGLNVVAYDPYQPAGVDEAGVLVSHDLAAVLASADYVSLHAPLTGDTRHMVNRAFLQAMKPTAYLVNTSRGPLVDEDALGEALREAWIAGAGLDVLQQEPPAADHPLLGLPNLIVTPHAAFDSVEATQELQERSARHVVLALQGQTPPHVLNPGVCEQANYRVKTMG